MTEAETPAAAPARLPADPDARNAALERAAAELAAGAALLESGQIALRDQLKSLARAGVSGWVVPAEFGGLGLTGTDLIAGYVRLAEACLTPAFVMTQQHGACQRIAASSNEEVRRALLPGLVSGELFATVGISHLTTSRQHLDHPAVSAAPAGTGFILDGFVPWVTAGSLANYIVTGGTLAGGEQILAAVDASASGVEVLPPQPLLALNPSLTGPVRLNRVPVEASQVLAGPIPQVM
jgi:alkylation response protein AidB-like acyl-CoA dehydrogenase